MSVFALRSMPRPVTRSGRQAALLVVGAVKGVLRNWRLWRASRAMQALDDRTLRDIGVSRTGIDYAVRHGRGRLW